MAKKRKVPISHDEIVRRFAERLRAVRASRAMTQAELADQAGLTPAYISRLENGGAAPGIDLVAKLAKALGTTAADLLPEGEPADPLPGLKEQARQMVGTLFERGDQETFRRLNPFLALLVAEASSGGKSDEQG